MANVEYPVNGRNQNYYEASQDVYYFQLTVIKIWWFSGFYQIYSPRQGPVVIGKQPVSQLECCEVEEKTSL